MQKFTLYFLFILSAGFSACSAQKKAGQAGRASEDSLVKDSIVFYETNIEARQKNYMEQLIGSWTIDTMQRQAMMPGETLKNVYLVFNKDNAFTGNAGCNRISGKYTLKGTSIKFSDIISTKMACPELEKETALLQLMQQTVSAYTVHGNILLLRDGSSNIVFHASRRN